MTLKSWLDNRWLIAHDATRDEVAGLLSVIDRDLRDARLPNLSPDWRLSIAYNAALQCAVAALAVAGYRPARGGSHHYHSIESLKFTLDLDSGTIRVLDVFRKKRNIADYERAGTVSDAEVDELVALAEDLRRMLLDRIREEFPDQLLDI